MRVPHWVKNVFVLPGMAVALTVEPERASLGLVPDVLAGLLSIGLVSSSNYVINEVLDGPYDLQHPVKSKRPVPRGDVDVRLAWLQWAVLAIVGVTLGFAVSPAFSAVVLALSVFGIIYNVEPVRTKDIPYVDVLTEALNNPIRMLAGWLIVGMRFSDLPVSLLLSYWMIGCYFMAIKRYAEFRSLGRALRSRYRPVLGFYSEARLLTTVVFYASAAMLFLGAFTVRYRLELILSFPLIAVVMAYYLLLAFQPDSPVQAPEKLYREPVLVGLVTICAVIITILLIVDIPALQRVFRPTLPTQ